MVFFDLAKAFDTVWHRGLLAKLEVTFRVEDAALRWISSYLSARSQAVRLSYFLSDPLPVTSGSAPRFHSGSFVILALR